MADAQVPGLESELKKAFDGLHDALTRATEASVALSALAARVHAISDVFDQIDAAVREGRRQLAGASAAIGGAQAQATITRPTLVVPEEPVRTEPVRTEAVPVPFAPAPAVEALDELEPPPAAAEETAPLTMPEPDEDHAPANGKSEPRSELLSFRLEFESRPGPLDLRAVDDAISEHPDVRDIALLDYDGHRATLKVWVGGGASPIEIQQAIREQVMRLFPPDNDVSVIALEDAA